MSDSLIETDQQLRLTSADMPNEMFAPTESNGEYTAERLFRHRRHEYDLIVRMLGEGMSNISISRIMQCAEKTVAAVRGRELALLPAPDVKTALSKRWLGTLAISQDIMEEIAADPKRRAKVSLKDAAIVGSIATQNHQLLVGDATQRVEYVERTSEHNDLNDFLASLRSAKPATPELSQSTPKATPQLADSAEVACVQSQDVTDPVPS